MRDVVTCHYRNLWNPYLFLHSDSSNQTCGCEWIRCAEITYDWNLIFKTSAQNGSNHGFQQRRITAIRIAASLKLSQCEGAFCQRLKNQHARAAARKQCFDNRSGGIRSV